MNTWRDRTIGVDLRREENTKINEDEIKMRRYQMLCTDTFDPMFFIVPDVNYYTTQVCGRVFQLEVSDQYCMESHGGRYSSTQEKDQALASVSTLPSASLHNFGLALVVFTAV